MTVVRTRGKACLSAVSGRLPCRLECNAVDEGRLCGQEPSYERRQLGSLASKRVREFVRALRRRNSKCIPRNEVGSVAFGVCFSCTSETFSTTNCSVGKVASCRRFEQCKRSFNKRVLRELPRSAARNFLCCCSSGRRVNNRP